MVGAQWLWQRFVQTEHVRKIMADRGFGSHFERESQTVKSA